MFRDVLSAIEGIAVRPTLALLIFVALFVAMLIWVIRLSREYIENAKNIPLNEDKPPDDDDDKDDDDKDDDDKDDDDDDSDSSSGKRKSSSK